MISQDDTFSFRKEKAIKSHFYANAHELGRMGSEIRSLIRNRCSKNSSSERDLNPIFDKDLLVSGKYFFPTSPGVRRMVELASKLTR